MSTKSVMSLLLLLGTTLGLGALLRDRRDTQVTNAMTLEMQLATARSVEDFQRAISGDAVVLHLDVDWSGTAVMARPRIHRFMESVRHSPELANVHYVRVDLTNQDQPICKRVRAWLRQQGLNPFYVSNGSGTLLWLRSGKVLDYVDSAGEVSLEDLLIRSQRVFLNSSVSRS